MSMLHRMGAGFTRGCYGSVYQQGIRSIGWLAAGRPAWIDRTDAPTSSALRLIIGYAQTYMQGAMARGASVGGWGGGCACLGMAVMRQQQQRPQPLQRVPIVVAAAASASSSPLLPRWWRWIICTGLDVRGYSPPGTDPLPFDSTPPPPDNHDHHEASIVGHSPAAATVAEASPATGRCVSTGSSASCPSPASSSSVRSGVL